jgi:Flp pilus assembly protein TadG
MVLARARGEDGSVSETAVAFPLLIVVFMLVIQFTLAHHAKSVVVAAAQDGARSAQVESGGVAAGEDRAGEVVAQSARSLLSAVSIAVTSDGDRVSARVSGDVVRVVPIPGLHFEVVGTAGGPVEVFRPEAP